MLLGELGELAGGPPGLLGIGELLELGEPLGLEGLEGLEELRGLEGLGNGGEEGEGIKGLLEGLLLDGELLELGLLLLEGLLSEGLLDDSQSTTVQLAKDVPFGGQSASLTPGPANAPPPSPGAVEPRFQEKFPENGLCWIVMVSPTSSVDTPVHDPVSQVSPDHVSSAVSPVVLLSRQIMGHGEKWEEGLLLDEGLLEGLLREGEEGLLGEEGQSP